MLNEDSSLAVNSERVWGLGAWWNGASQRPYGYTAVFNLSKHPFHVCMIWHSYVQALDMRVTFGSVRWQPQLVSSCLCEAGTHGLLHLATHAVWTQQSAANNS